MDPSCLEQPIPANLFKVVHNCSLEKAFLKTKGHMKNVFNLAMYCF